MDTADILRELRMMGARTISVGSSRDPGSLAAAAAVADAWTVHGEVYTVLDWPRSAASWLRQARAFTRPRPDAWVVLGDDESWRPMRDRLTACTDWDPARTVRG